MHKKNTIHEYIEYKKKNIILFLFQQQHQHQHHHQQNI
jgi:hypothetical protein